MRLTSETKEDESDDNDFVHIDLRLVFTSVGVVIRRAEVPSSENQTDGV